MSLAQLNSQTLPRRVFNELRYQRALWYRRISRLLPNGNSLGPAKPRLSWNAQYAVVFVAAGYPTSRNHPRAHICLTDDTFCSINVFCPVSRTRYIRLPKHCDAGDTRSM